MPTFRDLVLPRFYLACSLIAVGVSGPGDAWGDEARRVHALVAVDYRCDPELPGQEANQENFVRLLKSVTTDGAPFRGEGTDYRVDPDRVSIRVVGRDGLGPGLIKSYFRDGADVGPDDVCLFYYSGHGATDPARGHFLATSGGNLSRTELIEAMRSRPHRLDIVLTDCCSSVGRYRPALAPGMGDASRTLRSLLFRHRGTVNITAATYDPRVRVGEFGWFVNYELPDGGKFPGGGIFTMSLCKLLESGGYEQLDANGDGLVGWDELVRPLRGAMARNYREMKQGSLENPRLDPDTRKHLLAQETQRPMVFSVASLDGGDGQVDSRRPRPRHRFGVNVSEVAGRGVRIDSVVGGTPATRVIVQEITANGPVKRFTAMAVGDLIQFVNEEPTPTLEAFFRELNKVPPGGELRIKGLDATYGWQRSYTATTRLD